MLGKIVKIYILIAIIAIAAAMYFSLRGQKENNNNRTNITNSPSQAQPEEINISKPESQTEIDLAQPPISEEKSAQTVPEKFLLDMPFYSQAPFSNWDKIHEEMCEESSLLNAGLYLLGKKLSGDNFEKELEKIKKLEEKELGDYKSNNVSEIKQISDTYFERKIQSKIIDDPTAEQIESEISQNHPIIVPLSGREIGNPNFTPPGPLYHMLVIKGYDGQNFITNDVGTRKGNSYTYRKGVIMKNMHDWNEKDIHLGEKRVLVLYK